MKSFEHYQKSSFLELSARQKIQTQLLRQHMTYCNKSSPFYRQLFKKHGVVPESVNLDNLQDVPFTDKHCLERSNKSFIAVSQESVADIVLSSGTTGAPTKIVYSQGDLERLAYNERQSLASCGLNAHDRVLLTCTIDRCFIAGLAYYSGARALGAACIRNGLNSLESHAGIIKLMNPTVIVGVPSFLRKLGNFVSHQKISVASVKKLVCIGEPLRNIDMQKLTLLEDIEKIWKAKAYSTYSSSEIVTTFCECERQNGGHLHPELAVAEIVDERGRRASAGAAGELVVTPLGIEGMPLVRFRTGDISFMIDEPCACGRKSPRLGPILGRKKQMLKIKGTTVYPLAVFSALDNISEISDYFITVFSQDALSDRLTVTVSLRYSCSVRRISEVLAASLRVAPEVVIASEEEVRRVVYNPSLRKPVRFFDRRKKV
ncbi:MAG: AMP-binding protein [Candidatus Omnitrophica bacterium]|nr:AMP-binding protein [Candidatus Omnitrophota bacterium]